MKTINLFVTILFLSAICVVPSCAVKEAQKEIKQGSRGETAERVQASNESMQQVTKASKIIGTPVKNPNGDNLGNIKELVIDPWSGKVIYAVLSSGGVLGMGDKLFIVPWKALNWPLNKEYYVLDLSKSTLTSAPGFDKKHWPDTTNTLELQCEGLNQFYPKQP
ncbi:PRC-barrel domain-containing protein [Methylicorpusculum sp.]|uniref:PRC-barrel domain-containing protein n=1 Tax=Methylicorpusculum sp. TaxID=2713644 RepID=UPI002733736C|nr:PRC-barrel domain-containing protein [Methylicorpusculum sp.]MDP3531429.1 PRC-barrel domain-containing protein [Methylicorpusculum sp.]MDZ4150595.1 PRC-barrel domain-containing protein [Methylicorpusculum sp.]